MTDDGADRTAAAAAGRRDRAAGRHVRRRRRVRHRRRHRPRQGDRGRVRAARRVDRDREPQARAPRRRARRDRGARRAGAHRRVRHPRRRRRSRPRSTPPRRRSGCPACSSTTRPPTSRCRPRTCRRTRGAPSSTSRSTARSSAAREFGRRHLAAGTPGSIINVGASYAWTGGPGFVHSAAAKAGVKNLTESLAVEWGPYGIQVNGARARASSRTRT